MSNRKRIDVVNIYSYLTQIKRSLGKIIRVMIFFFHSFFTGFDKLYVHSRPLSKLCEFDGKPPPSDYKSDCYQDVDETEYACKEKYRIMVISIFHDLNLYSYNKRQTNSEKSLHSLRPPFLV